MHYPWLGPLHAWKDRLRALQNIPAVLELLWRSGPPMVVCVVACRMVAATLPLAALYVGKLIIDLVVAAQSQHNPAAHRMWLLLGTAFGIAALGAVLGRAVDFCEGRLADQFSREVSLRVMTHASTLDLQSFEDPVFYDKLERARVQANDRIGMLNAMGQLLQQAVTLISLAAGVLFFSPLLFLLLLATIVPAFLGESHFAFLGYSLAYSLTPMRRELDYLRDLGTKKESAKELKIFGLGDFFRERFAGISGEIITRTRRLASRRLFAGALLAIVGAAGYYGAYAVLVLQALRGERTVGSLTFMAGALAGCSAQIQAVFGTFTGIADQALFLTDLIAFFAVKPKIRNSDHPRPGPRAITQGFHFDNVSFSYPGSERKVIRNLNLRIGLGERLAIVGENGQGKTTLVKLITRLYDPTEGRITLDGVDLREYDIAGLHRQVGVIFQDFMRYDMPARDNIAVGNISSDARSERMRDAVEKSGAREVVDRLPDGLDQMLGRRFEDGVDLSGGEWQKFALARAYFRDAAVLVLDEPTAALDAMAEYEVFRRFAELTKGKISILISHRFSTVRMSDRIVVLRDGAVNEEGTHQQLLERGGQYAGMFELQASSYR